MVLLAESCTRTLIAFIVFHLLASGNSYSRVLFTLLGELNDLNDESNTIKYAVRHESIRKQIVGTT